MPALSRARSPILVRVAPTRSNEAALFRVKRVRGEFGVGGSELFSGRVLKEPLRLESAEKLTGEPGALKMLKFRGATSTAACMMGYWYACRGYLENSS